MRDLWRPIALSLLAAAVLTACSLASEPIPAGPIQRGPLPGEVVAPLAPAALPRAAQGAQVYAASCAACHGPQGAGDGEMAQQIAQQGGSLPDFTDVALARSRSPREWYEVITNGRMDRLMPPWSGSLSDQQRWDVAYYLYTLSTPPQTIAEGEALYEVHFAAEYGARGEQIGLDDPATLASLSPQAIFDQYVAGKGDLTDEQRWAVVAYMQTFGYDASLEAVAAEPPAEAAPAEETAPAPEAGVVQGRVIVGSPQAALPSDLEVRLRGLTLDENNQVIEFLVRTTNIAPDGTYRFEGVPFDQPRAAYVVEATYNGVVFSNGQIVDPTTTSLDLPITIYESTTDPTVITVDAMHIVLREHPDALLVMQLYVFSNSSDRLFVSEQPVVGGRRGSVAIAIPADAYSVQFEDGQLGGRFIAVGDKIYDTDLMLPGNRSHNIVVTYFLPFNGSREVRLPILYNTRQVTVLAQEGQRVRADGLNEAGTEVIGDVAYNQYIGTDFSPADTLTLRIQRQVALQNFLPLVMGSLAALLLIAAVVYWLIQRRTLVPVPVVAGLTPQQEALLREIVRLDEEFAAGRINRLIYEAQRAELKATLAELMQKGEG